MTSSGDPAHGRLPSLDGIRALAVGLVVVAHARSYGIVSVPLVGHWDLGNLGVRVFFVLSGFLITSLLTSELAATGSISLRAFYLRRALRIFPAFYLMLVAAVIAWQAGWLSLNWPSVVVTALYLANMRLPGAMRMSPAIGHTWSLAVEEQFYLLWPATLRALRIRRAATLLVGAILLAPIVRLALDDAGHQALARYAFPAVMDALATGCLLALARNRLMRSRVFVALTRTRLGAWLLVLLPVLAWTRLPVPVRDLIAIPALNLSIALLLEWTLSYRHGIAYRLLNLPSMAYLGRVSYGIYLWQSPILFQDVVHAPALVFGLILAFALASYHLVEQPFLRLRSRLGRRRGERPMPLPALPRSAVWSPLPVASRPADDPDAPPPAGLLESGSGRSL
jgi:peptidoglycan/LPS O-acetylase OafA/YrhL